MGCLSSLTVLTPVFWPEIDFADDRDGCLFTETVHQKAETISGKMDVLPVSSG